MDPYENLSGVIRIMLLLWSLYTNFNFNDNAPPAPTDRSYAAWLGIMSMCAMKGPRCNP